ncbi:MAG: imidazole glycerol phosphate synthase subunit HisH [Labilithrix sp.]|nr:imidazole glycerol phosphate synthase subunit HisH [Labilithrix sp.]MCW5814734.1 imidazole glycerol phosphate synthase subunit HisH [Labilithrix sp.]
MTRVVVLDYGLGNLYSVIKALRHEGGDVVVSSNGAELEDASRVVLPGVGAFADGMRELDGRGLVEPLHRYMDRGRPLLGICLGMQLLLGASVEFGHTVGLGRIPGTVVRIVVGAGAKVPHVGWNALVESRPWKETPLDGLQDQRPMVYFVHSYAAEPTNAADRLAEVDYGGARLTAAVARDNVVGVQFHPEMSGLVGLAVVRRFLRG